jgi:hypothetical protein
VSIFKQEVSLDGRRAAANSLIDTWRIRVAGLAMRTGKPGCAVIAPD